MIRYVWFLRYGAQQTDRQMDGQKKCHIEVGTPPKNWCPNFDRSNKDIILILFSNC